MKPYTTASIRGFSRAEWLKMRQRGIGGSDAPHIVLTPEEFRYADIGKLYLDKTEPILDDGENLPCRIGHMLEPLAAELFTEATGKAVHCVHQMFVSRAYTFMRADIDRKLTGVEEGLECKAIGWMSARRRIIDPETEETRWIDIFEAGDAEAVFRYKPEWYVQMQHYMAVTGWNMWHLGVIVGNQHFYHFDVPRDDALIAVMIEAEREFWNCVERRENIWEV